MDTIITVLNATTETSMPFNEFVIWRAKHYQDQRQILIVCNKVGDLPKIEIPSNVEIIRCEKKIKQLRKVITKTVGECKRRGDRYTIHLHNADSGLWAQIAMMGTGLRKKTLFTTHNTFSGYPFHNKVRSYINGLFAHYISVVSNTAFDGYPKSLKIIKKEKVVAIQNGVDIERIDSLLESDYKKELSKIVFVYVARMVPVKNHAFLLNIIKRINPNVCFEFIGAISEEVKHRVESEGFDGRVIMTGLIPRNEVFKKLQEAHFYISSSILEGLPVSLLEGMYAGLPAIVSNIPQHLEVSDNSDFITIMPLEEDSWIERINYLSSLTVEEMIDKGRKAKEYIRENFSLERMHKQYDDIYESIFQI